MFLVAGLQLQKHQLAQLDNQQIQKIKNQNFSNAA